MLTSNELKKSSAYFSKTSKLSFNQKLKNTNKKKPTSSMANVSQTAEPTIAFASKLDCDICHEQKCPSGFTRAFLYKLLERCRDIYPTSSRCRILSDLGILVQTANVFRQYFDIFVCHFLRDVAHHGIHIITTVAITEFF